MLALPPAPRHKLLTGYVIGVDLASGPDVTVEERWWSNGRYQMFVNGKLAEDGHYFDKPPFVLTTFDSWPWETQ